MYALTALTSCNGVDPGKLVGAILSDALEPVQQAVERAGQTANGVLLTAAGQVQLTIYQAQSAFGDQLNKGVNQVDEAVKNDLNKITDLANQLTSASQQVLEKATDDATVLLNRIPFTNKNPSLRSYTPTVTTAASAATGLVVTLKGNFFRASQPGYSPKLKVNGVEAAGSLVSNTETELKFRLPPGTFSASTGLAAPDIEVALPYEKGGAFTRNKSIVPGVFRLLIGTLPDSPVRSLTLIRTGISPETEERRAHPEEPNPHIYVSSLNCHNAEASQTWVPGQGGWLIDVNSIKIHVDEGYPKGGSGEVEGPYVTAISPTGFTVQAKTHPAGLCGWPVFQGGRTAFYVSYDEVRPVPGSPVDAPPEQLTLNWGDEKSEVVPQPPGRWRLLAVLFDGTQLQSPPDVNNKFITIKDLGRTVSYKAKALSDVSLTSVTP